jgi:MFS superfamily sulfate permease-like transporter
MPPKQHKPTTSTTHQQPPKRDFYEGETWFGLFLDYINPIAYARWLYRSIIQVGHVLYSFQDLELSDVTSGVVLGVLMAAFSIVFSTAIFDEVNLDEFFGVGGGMQTVTIIISGIFHTFFSDLAISIAAPDLNPAVLFSNMALTCRQTMEANAKKLPISQTALMTTVLATIIVSTFCLGILLYLVGRLRLTRVVQMLPESVLTGFMGTIGYIVLHKALRISIPINIWQAGPSLPQWWMFAGPAMGFGLLMYLREFLNPYVTPAFSLPIIMVAPLIAFWVAVYVTGGSVDTARDQGWMFPIILYSGPGVGNQYQFSWGNAQLVDWNAVWATFPQMILFWIIIGIDTLFKLAGTRKALFATQINFDHEMMLAGKSNIACALLAGVPGYNQPYLTIVNHSITNTLSTRIPGFLAVMFNLLLLVVGYPAINFLPRFWLGGLVAWTAAKFVIDNLLLSWRRLSMKEYLAVILIVVINALVGLGWSILAGLSMAGAIFAIMYGRDGSIRSVHSGSDIRSTVTRSVRDEQVLQHLGKSTVVVCLHRYIFFGSATQIMDMIQGLLEGQNTRAAQAAAMAETATLVSGQQRNKNRNKVDVEEANDEEDVEKLTSKQIQENEDDLNESAANAATIAAGSSTVRNARYIVFDFDQVEDIDSTAMSVFSEMLTRIKCGGIVDTDLEKLADKNPKCITLFCGLSTRQHTALYRAGVLKRLYLPQDRAKANIRRQTGDDAGIESLDERGRRCFGTLDLAMEWVEERLLEHASVARMKWMKLDSLFRLHQIALKRGKQDSSLTVLGGNRLGDAFSKIFERIRVPQNAILWKEGDYNNQLYYVVSGRLTAYTRKRRAHTYRAGSFFNEDSLYVDLPVSHTVMADTEATVFQLSREGLKRLRNEFPEVAFDLQKSILQSSARMKATLERTRNARDHFRERLQDDEDANNNNNSGMVEDESEATSKNNKNNNTSSAVVVKRKIGLLDTTVLNEGIQNGRRMAMEFTRRARSELASDFLGFGTSSSSNSNSGMRRGSDDSMAGAGGGGGRVGKALSNQASARYFSNFVSFDTIDEQIKKDWIEFVGDMGNICRAVDVHRVLDISMPEAEECVFFADLEDRGGLSFFDFLDNLCTIHEAELTGESFATTLAESSTTTTTTTTTTSSRGVSSNNNKLSTRNNTNGSETGSTSGKRNASSSSLNTLGGGGGGGTSAASMTGGGGAPVMDDAFDIDG